MCLELNSSGAFSCFSVISVIIFFSVGRISGLEKEVKEVKSSLSKVQTEKKQLHEKLNDLEKVGCYFYRVSTWS